MKPCFDVSRRIQLKKKSGKNRKIPALLIMVLVIDFGKTLTILFAIIGIPLMLLFLTNIGDVMAQIFRLVYSIHPSPQHVSN
jgi:hypothetical protein